jgi:hypothetical protein
MPLRPFKYDVYFYYRCDKCGAEVQQSEQEIKFVGKFVCYGCNNVMKFDKITGVKVSPQYVKEKSKLVVTNSLPVAQLIDDQHNVVTKSATKVSSAQFDEKTEEVVKGLIKLGFYKAQATAAVNRVIDSGEKYRNENELFEACFNEARK